MAADPNSPAAQAALKAAGWTQEQYRQYAATRPDLGGFSGANPLAGASDADLMALLGGGGEANGSLSDLPLGYSYDRATNQVYRQTANGPVAVGREELLAATLAEKQMAGGGGGGGAAPPRPESMIDPRTGELVMIDANGGVTRTGNILGFGEIDPREKFAAEENQRGFSNAMAQYQAQMEARQQAIDQFEAAQNRLIQVAGQKEQGRQADLRAAVDQWQTAMNLIPQMGQLAIQESERVQGILQNGGDFLARAFESRGGTSPLAKVTQADQINAIGQSLANLRGMINQNTAGGPAGGGGYQAPELGQYGGGGGAGELPPVPEYKPYQMAPAPAVTPPSAPAAAGGGGGFANAAPASAYNPAMDRDPWEGNDPASRAGATGLNSRDNPNIFPGLVDQPATPAPAPFTDWGSPEADMGAARDVSDFNYRPGADYLGRLGKFLGFKDGTPSTGYTTAPVFVGNEDGPELFENPTGAPLRIHDAEATRKMVPGFDEGDGSYGYDDFRDFSDISHMDYSSLPGAMVGGGIAGGGFRQLFGLARRPAPRPPVGPLVRDVGVGAYSPRRPVGFQGGEQMYGSVPRYATGTGFDAGSYFNNTNYGKGFDASKSIMGFTRAAANDVWQQGGGGQLNTLPGGGTTTSALTGIQPGQSYGNYYQQYGGRDQYGHQLDNPTDAARNAHWNTPEALAARRGEQMPGFKGVTQRELNDLARSTAPPAVTAALAGKLPPAVEQLKSTAGEGETLPIMTARQLSAMTPEEIKALGTTTNTIFNAPLEYIMGQTNRNYGAKEGMQRGFLRGAGL